MTRRSFVLACCMLVIATPLVAQSRGDKPTARADALTGTWTGELSPGDGRSIAVTMELKFDGKKVVTGTASGLPNPADVKAGTFDPKTGALKLQLGKTTDAAVLLTLEGTVVKNTASGKISGEIGGEFKIAKKK